MTRPTWLLFDLGGVLVDFAGWRELPSLLPPGRDIADIKRRMADCPSTDAVERGAISPEEFAARFVQAWGITLDPSRFLQQYVDWVSGPYPGVPQLLEALRREYRLACLSNTNAAHWERSPTMRWLRDTLDVALASHEMQLRKPEPAIFTAALRRLGVPANEVGYFDDMADNVHAAAAVGLQAHYVDGPQALQARPRALGWLAP